MKQLPNLSAFIYARSTDERMTRCAETIRSSILSYPGFSWQKLRKETPEKDESYVDLEVGKWIKVKIVVQDSTARLYVHEATQPALQVTDLKHGTAQKGSIGLWIGSGTEAHFQNLIVTRYD